MSDAIDAVIWHDLECGGYREDLAVWLALAAEQGGPILEIGAGTGRVALQLARAGYELLALDLDARLLAELDRRATSLPLTTIRADARDFSIPDRSFPLIIVPMQTIQLLGGEPGRAAFLQTARRHLRPGGTLAVALTEDLVEFEWQDGDAEPIPDIVELDGAVYCSQPTAIRRQGAGFVLERARETVHPSGERATTEDRVALDSLSTQRLLREAAIAGLRGLATRQIPPTLEHVGSEVVMLGA